MAAKASPEGELAYAVELINRVTEGISGPVIGVHVCRGNWSQEEGVLLQGGYEPLIPWLAQMKVGQFALEYATSRAGRLEAVAGLPKEASLGLGVVNPRTTKVEDLDWIVGRARAAAELLGGNRVFLNPDCGFGTFADRPVSTHDVAYRKMVRLAEAARTLRSR